MIFPSFSQFSMELDDAGRDLKADATQIGAMSSVGRCDSKSANNNTVFPCLVLGGCDELAFSVGVEDRKTALLASCRPVWARDTSFGCLTMLEEGDRGVLLVQMVDFSTFSGFWTNPIVSGCVSRAVMVEDSDGML